MIRLLFTIKIRVKTCLSVIICDPAHSVALKNKAAMGNKFVTAQKMATPIVRTVNLEITL